MLPGDVAVHKREQENAMQALEQRIAKGVELGTTLQQAISDYAKAHNVSLSVACDAVCMSPAVSERVNLEKRALEIGKRDAVDADKANEALQHFMNLAHQHAQANKCSISDAMAAVQRTKHGSDLWQLAPGADIGASVVKAKPSGTAMARLHGMAEEHNKQNPHLTREQSFAAICNTREGAQALRADREERLGV
jgi:hypothetical protein